MPKPPLAVLIDAENIAADHYPWLRTRMVEIGDPIIQRLFGDFSGTRLTGWRKHAVDYGLQPVLQLNGGKGKNSTDIALAIHAMDLLHGGRIGGICLVSSDRDFVPLAQRLREGGLLVYGFGRKTIDAGLASCCTDFIDLPSSAKPSAGQPKPAKSRAATPPVLKPVATPSAAPANLPETARLVAFLCKLADDEGESWVKLSLAGAALRKHDPATADLVCGNGKLLRYLKAKEMVDVEGSGSAIQIRVKASPAAA
ncbi:MAG: NYN domain-containing protein [Mesorhizobium sp.]|nr:NYN domain-containing protein [Mesorhizobium sp.]